MATAGTKKQKLIIQDVLSSPDIYNRTSGILNPDYFDAEYKPVVRFIHDYYGKYGGTPDVDQLDAEFDVEFEKTDRITKDRIESTCDEIEMFCRETALREAVFAALPLIDEGNMTQVLSLVTDALNVSLQRDMGVDIYENPEERLQSLVEDYTPIPTLIGGIDGPLEGGLIRKTFTLFSANSGGGKSIMLANIGANYAAQGLHVLYLSLELPAEMVFLRLASIVTGHDAATWKAHIPEIAGGLIQAKNQNNGGSYLVKRIPQHSTAADIRSFLSFYEMEYDRVPDVLLIDYLDLMDPNSGVNGIGVFEQDKRKSEEVVEILHEYDMIGVSASQQNRDAINMATPNHSIIAGGISKINTVDNYISLFMDETLRLQGEMNAYFLKTRSSRGVNTVSVLDFDVLSLRITDPKDGTQSTVMPTRRKDKTGIEAAMEQVEDGNTKVTAEVSGLPGVEETEAAMVKEVPPNLFDDADQDPIMPKIKVTESDAQSLIDLMSSLDE